MDTFRFKADRDNLALTIFVPWDCSKNCSFCTTKQEYKKKLASVDGIIDIAKVVLSKAPSIRDVVISGGEPLDDIENLYKIVSSLKRKRIFINTSFPKIKEKDKEKFNLILKRISGLNVSRHLGHNYSSFSSYEEIIELVGNETPVRINILLEEHMDAWTGKSVKLIKHIQNIMSYNYFNIQLRANYNKTTTWLGRQGGEGFELENDYDITSMYIKSFGETVSSGCRVCHTITAKYNDKNTISFHKGLKHTSTYSKVDYLYHINDFIITASGELKRDWEGNPINPELLEDETFRLKFTHMLSKYCGITYRNC
jgi:hypothetical protein